MIYNNGENIEHSTNVDQSSNRKVNIDSNFKLHIDSNLIKTNSSALPEELKDLGVCAYDENDFEEGL